MSKDITQIKTGDTKLKISMLNDTAITLNANLELFEKSMRDDLKWIKLANAYIYVPNIVTVEILKD